MSASHAILNNQHSPPHNEMLPSITLSANMTRGTNIGLNAEEDNCSTFDTPAVGFSVGVRNKRGQDVVERDQKNIYPWKVSTLPNIGKVLLATRDIRPWEMVLHDSAIITAPTFSPVCLGCLGDI